MSLALGGEALAGRTAAGPRSRRPADVVPFHGRHQAGITTSAQGRLAFAAFDLTVRRAAELRDLLRVWSAAAARMTLGDPVGPSAGAPAAAPIDPGEALGLGAARLTLTLGLGLGAFIRGGGDRLGLAARRPGALTPLPPLPGERLDPARSDGDLCVQACADDPQVAFHAVHALAHLGRGAVVLRWLQTGFTDAPAGPGPHPAPRNLQGFRDGTNNIRGDDGAALRRFVWVGDEEPQRWLRGGTYLVCRRIRMRCEIWDSSPLAQQEQVIGRHKLSGAPLGARHEGDPLDLAARAPDGQPVIPMTAHVRLAAPATNRGVRILRRGYSFADGVDPASGEVDAGLFFISFQRDPKRQFVALQRRLGTSDALNDYIEHRSSALFAVPPGVRPGGFLGEGLFAT